VVLGLFLMGLLVVFSAASIEHAPGYMDAEYYYAGGIRLASGQPGAEPYLWNYLNQPQDLSAPPFSYWMPLVSILAAVGLVLAPSWGFWGARLVFLLLAACIPPLTAFFSLRLTHNPRQARFAGALALFPGFYLVYFPTTDAFSIYMVVGAAFLLLAFDPSPFWSGWKEALRFFLLGLLVGLLHLARADGLLWLAGAGCVALARALQPGFIPGKWLSFNRKSVGWLAALGGAILLGYGLVMGPWVARNLGEWGNLMPPGGSRAIWITTYEETMSFPASQLTPQHWLSAGAQAHLTAWLRAAGNHFQTAVAVQGSIVLFPFILIGLWKLRQNSVVKLGAGMWLLTVVVMTFVFPFAGINGSFFHSGAALQVLWWAAAPVGVEAAVDWYTRVRHMPRPESFQRFIRAVLVGAMLFFSGVVTFQLVIGSDPRQPRWEASARHYQAVEQTLQRLGAGPGAAVLVNDPPGYWLQSGRPAGVIPNGDAQTLLAAARQYGVHYIILEDHNPQQLANLYHGREIPSELRPVGSVGTTRLFFRIETP
jgi:hypothetical protein